MSITLMKVVGQPKRKARAPQTLRRTLQTFLAVVWMFMLVLIGVTVVYFVQRTEQEAWRGRQGEAARNAASSVADFLRRANDALVLIAYLGRDELVADPKVLATVVQSNPALQEVVFLDAAGKVIASGYQEQPLLANLFTIPQSEWFVMARGGRSLLWQPAGLVTG